MARSATIRPATTSLARSWCTSSTSPREAAVRARTARARAAIVSAATGLVVRGRGHDDHSAAVGGARPRERADVLGGYRGQDVPCELVGDATR